MSGNETEKLGDLLLKYVKGNIGALHELIEGTVGDVEQAIVTANGDVLSKVTAARILGGIAEDLSALESAMIHEENRSALINVMLDAVGTLLRAHADLNAGRPLDDIERELRGLQLTLGRTVDRLVKGCTRAQAGEARGSEQA